MHVSLYSVLLLTASVAMMLHDVLQIVSGKLALVCRVSNENVEVSR